MSSQNALYKSKMADGCHLYNSYKSLYLSNRLTDFNDLYTAWRVSVQECASWGSLYCTLFFFWGGGQMPPKLHLTFGGKTLFKPIAQNIQTFILGISKLLQRFQPNTAQTDLQILLVGRPKVYSTNPRWQTAAILKKINHYIHRFLYIKGQL